MKKSLFGISGQEESMALKTLQRESIQNAIEEIFLENNMPDKPEVIKELVALYEVALKA